jgi:hypothetical protein
MAKLNGDQVQTRIDTGVVLVTAENLNSQEIHALLNPTGK